MDSAKDLSMEAAGALEQLRTQHEAEGATEQRRHSRKSWRVVLTIEFEEKFRRDVIRRPAEVTTHDISRGGFSFVFDQYVHVGTRVCAHFDNLSKKPRINGVVRNAIHLSGKQYRIGVEFEESRRGAES